MNRLLIGVSSCLLGERVRYDGDHRRDRFIAEVLSRYVEYVPFCPEVSAGLGVPRATIRLYARGSGVRAIQEGGRDVTAALARGAAGMAARSLAGYLLKARSPSCGLKVKVHGDPGSRRAAGIFAAALQRRLPLLPLEDESRLADPARRDSFLARAFVYDRWRRAGVTRASLPEFHGRYGALVRPWSAAAHADMEALARGTGCTRPEIYLRRFLNALARPCDPARVAGALAASGNARFRKAMEEYRRGRVPLVAALAHMEE